jgi:2-C-methyl-D-erythritol 4-phosphate cytidylyltransferase
MENCKENHIVIVAGGIGQRMESEIPKQFLCIKSKPILMHTIERFFNFDNSSKIILSLPENQILYWKNLCEEYNFVIPHKIVEGGKTRFHSVKNALAETNGKCFTAVHDGVRPLVSSASIKSAFETAYHKGNAVLSREINFSIRKISGRESIAVNRNEYKEIQTPQIFKTDILKAAYGQDFKDFFTDDASVVEAFGEKIFLCEGNIENIKITNKSDLILAESLIHFVS